MAPKKNQQQEREPSEAEKAAQEQYDDFNPFNPSALDTDKVTTELESALRETEANAQSERAASLIGNPVPSGQAMAEARMNSNVHVGRNAHRPFDAAAAIGVTPAEVYARMDAVQRVLANAPAESGIKFDEQEGVLYWERLRHTGRPPVMRGGVLHHGMYRERRKVALSPRDAIADPQGLTDYWDGSTMYMRGVKRSQEYAENLGTIFTPEDMIYVPAEAEDQAAAAAKERSVAARTPDIDEGRELQERGQRQG
jgi:hypothetical protein